MNRLTEATWFSRLIRASRDGPTSGPGRPRCRLQAHCLTCRISGFMLEGMERAPLAGAVSNNRSGRRGGGGSHSSAAHGGSNTVTAPRQGAGVDPSRSLDPGAFSFTPAFVRLRAGRACPAGCGGYTSFTWPMRLATHASAMIVVHPSPCSESQTMGPCSMGWICSAHFGEMATLDRGFGYPLGGRVSGRRGASAHPLILTSFVMLSGVVWHGRSRA
jgi:hypothetical protein